MCTVLLPPVVNSIALNKYITSHKNFEIVKNFKYSSKYCWNIFVATGSIGVIAVLPAAALISVLQMFALSGVPRDMKNYSRGSPLE